MTRPSGTDTAPSTVSSNGSGPTVDGWPEPLSEAAYHGVTGEIVSLVTPQTEADPAAVLIQLLAVVGTAMGRHPYFNVGQDRHSTNLNVLVVGESSLSAKGRSLGEANAPVLTADPTLKVTTGLSSGEGLIAEVRDPVERRRKAKKDETGDADGFITFIEDEGVADKRLLIEETEFASVLTRMSRDGNSLSPVLRQAWDGVNLRTMTKGSPAVATNPHVSVCGHIVLDELRQKMGQTEVFNGFGNRFLWVCARRHGSLPRGGIRIDWRNSPQVKQLQKALRKAHKVMGGPAVGFSDEAGDLWDARYEGFVTGRTGVVAAVTNRAAAQTRRIATIYAVLDCKPAIELVHLEAALEVWRYAEHSARYLFGDSTGDPVADMILGLLRGRGEEGMSRTEIRDMLGRNLPSDRITSALVVLHIYGLARMERVETGGRPAEHWFATTADT